MNYHLVRSQFDADFLEELAAQFTSGKNECEVVLKLLCLGLFRLYDYLIGAEPGHLRIENDADMFHAEHFGNPEFVALLESHELSFPVTHRHGISLPARKGVCRLDRAISPADDKNVIVRICFRLNKLVHDLWPILPRRP